MSGSETTFVGVGPTTLFVEQFASKVENRDSAAVLLLSAAEAPSSRWPDHLVEVLANQVGSVIRFDTRDSGHSGDVEEDYTLDDLAVDAVQVLDSLGIDAAHVIGRSMGGMVAQLLALDFADRVRSLTLLSSSAGPDDSHGGPAEWFVDRMTERLLNEPPATIEERAAWIAQQQGWFVGPRFEFDHDAATRRALAEVNEFWHEDSGHGRAVVASPSRYERLADVACPALVVHGTFDPVYPAAHGLALANGIPDSTLRLVDGLGHELPEEFAPQFAAWILDFVDRG